MEGLKVCRPQRVTVVSPTRDTMIGIYKLNPRRSVSTMFGRALLGNIAYAQEEEEVTEEHEDECRTCDEIAEAENVHGE
uniref:Uncharacterized protein n=1 Tax=Parascaris univalens TaxID=6257 RepID=A0A915BE00_PARUN